MVTLKSNKNIFGIELTKASDEKLEKVKQKSSFTIPDDQDAVVLASAAGAYGITFELATNFKSENDLIMKYRSASKTPEADSAIEEIINEAIIPDDDTSIVKLNFDDVENKKNISEKLQTKVKEEFDYILNLMEFEFNAFTLFKCFYVDGRQYLHKVIDEAKKSEGIKGILKIDPRKIRKIKEVEMENSKTGAEIPVVKDEYYIYNKQGIEEGNKTQGYSASSEQLKISKDLITYVHSGEFSENGDLIHSHLHKALKVINQLRMVEDSLVIYRVSRAPERRVFYVDVGNLPAKKAEEYLRKIMVQYKNKLVYNPSTGEIDDNKRFSTMLEDYWLPRREGSNSTEIDTLQGAQSLDQIADIEYFKTKLYQCLNVPISRLQPDNTFSLGRSGEITRDEVKFNKFVRRIRARWAKLFDDILCTQLLLKNVINSKDEWEKDFRPYIRYVFNQDEAYRELMQTEIFRERLGLLAEAEQYRGIYFSKEYIQKNILKQSDDEINAEEKRMEKEKTSGMEDDDLELQQKRQGAFDIQQQQQSDADRDFEEKRFETEQKNQKNDDKTPDINNKDKEQKKDE